MYETCSDCGRTNIDPLVHDCAPGAVLRYQTEQFINEWINYARPGLFNGGMEHHWRPWEDWLATLAGKVAVFDAECDRNRA